VRKWRSASPRTGWGSQEKSGFCPQMTQMDADEESQSGFNQRRAVGKGGFAALALVFCLASRTQILIIFKRPVSLIVQAENARPI
jgi:hypothetical protein